MPARTPAATRPPSVNSTIGAATNDSTHTSTPRSHQKAVAPKKSVPVSIAANALLQRATAVIRPPVQKKASRNALFGLLTRFTGLLSVEPHWPQNLASGGPSHPQLRHVRVCSVTSESDYARELLPRSPASVLYQHTAASLDVQGDHTACQQGHAEQGLTTGF